MPSISVVIPLYNKAATLGRALDSVLNQSGDDLEVIVIDDASTDASNEVALSFGNRINYVRQENAGPSAARNHGARIARHPLLLFLDADDSLAPGALVAHARAHACIPGSGLSAGSFKLHTLDGSMEEERLDQRGVRLNVNNGVMQAFGLSSRLIIYVPPGAVCISRELFDQIGGFDETLRSWEISDFMLRAGLASPGFAVLPQICLDVFQTPGSASTVTHKHIVYMERYCRKALALMHAVPAAEQPALLRGMKSFMETMWDSGAIAEFQALALDLCPLLARHDMATKICGVARLPARALLAASVLKRTLRRVVQ